MKTKNYKSVALSEEAYKELLEVSKHENRPIGRELAGLIKMKYITGALVLVALMGAPETQAIRIRSFFRFIVFYAVLD